MAQETKVKVRIDTKQATAQLNGLVKESARVAGKVAGGVRSAVGRGMGIVGLGGGIGVGMAAMKSSTQSGMADIIGETTGRLGAQISDFFLGDLPQEARAAKHAREETINAFGAIAGATDTIPPQAKGYFDAIAGRRLEIEKGRKMFEKHEDFTGPGIKDMVDRILEGLKTLLDEAIAWLASALNPFD